MVVMNTVFRALTQNNDLGITNVDSQNDISYADDVAILDMSTWTWVTSIPAGTRPQPVNPGCRFDMRVSPDDNSGGGGNGGNGSDRDALPYDSTVVSNPNKNDTTALKEGLGISFGVLGLALVGALVFFIRRMRQGARMVSPRWLPGILTRSSSTRSRQSTTSSLPSTQSETKDDNNNTTTKSDPVPLYVITEHP
jgi:hypothetical protein